MRSCARARRRERARCRAPAKARRGGGRVQVFENDMRLGRCAAGRVVCVVVDEAHKVTGETVCVAHKVTGKTGLIIQYGTSNHTIQYMHAGIHACIHTHLYVWRTRLSAKLDESYGVRPAVHTDDSSA